jgi:alcohol dehydrogenase
VRITTSIICGSDLHILNGDVPTVKEGRILGHEGIGVIDEVGVAVSAFRKGDKVVISRITACGKCDFCRKQMYSLAARGAGF